MYNARVISYMPSYSSYSLCIRTIYISKYSRTVLHMYISIIYVGFVFYIEVFFFFVVFFFCFWHENEKAQPVTCARVLIRILFCTSIFCEPAYSSSCVHGYITYSNECTDMCNIIIVQNGKRLFSCVVDMAYLLIFFVVLMCSSYTNKTCIHARTHTHTT